MQRILLCLSATPKSGPWADLFAEYRLWLKKGYQLEEKYLEGAALERLLEGRRYIALEATGEQRSSEAFAKMIEEAKDRGETLTFVMGGPDGLSPSVKSGADRLLSLSALTFPHDAAAVLLLEQLFRAHAIMTGKTYHR